MNEVPPILRLCEKTRGVHELVLEERYDCYEDVVDKDLVLGKYESEPEYGIKIDEKVVTMIPLPRCPEGTSIFHNSRGTRMIVCSCYDKYTFVDHGDYYKYIEPCLLKLKDGRYILGFIYRSHYYMFLKTGTSLPYLEKPKHIAAPNIKVEKIRANHKGYVVTLRQGEPRIYLVNDNQFILVEYHPEEEAVYKLAVPFYQVTK